LASALVRSTVLLTDAVPAVRGYGGGEGGEATEAVMAAATVATAAMAATVVAEREAVVRAAVRAAAATVLSQEGMGGVARVGVRAAALPRTTCASSR